MALLLVDDEPLVAQFLSKLLAPTGVELHLASNAEEALRLLDSTPLGCMLVDKNLPGMDGIALMGLARQKQPHLAFIVMTAYASTASAVEALRLGATDYLEKPFADLDLVVTKIEGALARKRVEFERHELLLKLRDFKTELGEKDRRVVQQRDEIELFNQILELRVRQATEDLHKQCSILEGALRRGADTHYAIGVHAESLLEDLLLIEVQDGQTRGALVRLRRRLEAHLELVRKASAKLEGPLDGKPEQPNGKPGAKPLESTHASEPVGAQTSAAPSRPRVLVVEDEDVIRLLVKKSLVGAGYDVVTAADGPSAIAQLERDSFDAVITDKNLPAPDGVVVARTARQRNPQAAIIIITAYASKNAAEELLDIGIDEHLSKPFELEYLSGRLPLLIARRRAKVRQSSPRKIRRVLVVEPEPKDRARMSTLLTSLGYLPIPRAQLETGLSADPPPEGLIVASEVLSESAKATLIAAQAHLPDLKVIFVSASEGIDDTINAILVGAADHLARPWDDPRLNTAIRKAFG